MWATFKVGGIISSANPSYTASELTFQLKLGAFGSGFLEEGGGWGGEWIHPKTLLTIQL